MNKNIKHLFQAISVTAICITGVIFLTNLYAEMNISVNPANTENYTVTNCVADDNVHYVTMQNEKKNQEIVFELGNRKFKNFDFSEKTVIPLDIGKAEDNKNVYFIEDERLLTVGEMNKATGMLEKAVIIITAFVFSLIMFTCSPAIAERN